MAKLSKEIIEEARSIFVISMIAFVTLLIIGILGEYLTTLIPPVPPSSPAYNITQIVYHGISTITNYTLHSFIDIFLIIAVIDAIEIVAFLIRKLQGSRRKS